MQKYAHLNRDVKNGTLHIPIKKKWVSHIQFPWIKGAYRIPGSAEKGGLFGPHIHTMSYIGSYPPPRGLHTPGGKSSRGRTKQRQSFAFFHQLTTRLSQHSDMEYEIRIHGLPVLL